MYFDDAYKFLRGEEGGYSNNSADRGGATQYGISSKWYPEQFATVRALTQAGKVNEAEAFTKNFYKTEFWDKIGGDKLDRPTALALFDTAVNSGVPKALQLYKGAGSDPVKLIGARKQFLQDLVSADPSQQEFANGWANRLSRLEQAVGDAKFQPIAWNTNQPARDASPAGYRGFPLPTQEQSGVTQVSDWRTRAQPIQPVTSAGNLTLQPQAAPVSDWRSRAVAVQPQVSGSDWRSRAAAVQPTTQPEQLGFIDKVKQAYAGRDAQIQEQVDATARGEQTQAEMIAQNALSNASKLPDTVGAAITSLPIIGPKIEGAGREVVDAVSKIPTWSKEAPTVGELLSKTAKEHPRLARNLGMAGQAVNLAGTALGMRSIGNMAEAKIPQKPIKNPEGIIASTPKAPKATAADINTAVTENYDTARWLGANYKPDQVSNQFIKAIRDTEPKPIAGVALTSEDKALIGHLKEYQDLSGKKMTLDDVQRLDESLTQKITDGFIDKQTGAPNANGRKLQILQHKLRKIVDDVPDNAGNDALTNGRSAYAAKRRLDDLNAIAERAQFSTNPAAAAQRGYAALYLDKEAMRGWPKEAKALLKKAGTPGIGAEALSLITSRLPAMIGMGTGNIGGAAGAHLLGMAARGGREAIVAKRGARVGQAVIDDAMGKMRPVNVPKPDYPEQLQLAAPDKMSPLPMSDAQVNIAQQLMRKKPSADNAPAGTIQVRPTDGQAPQKLLPAPNKVSQLPMSEQQVTVAQQLMNKQPAKGADLSGAAIRPPVSQVGKLEGSLKGIKRNQFDNMRTKLRSGELSQNKFVEQAKKAFKLTETQARSLAKEVKTYGKDAPKKESVLKKYLKDETGTVNTDAFKKLLNRIDDTDKYYVQQMLGSHLSGKLSRKQLEEKLITFYGVSATDAKEISKNSRDYMGTTYSDTSLGTTSNSKKGK